MKNHSLIIFLVAAVLAGCDKKNPDLSESIRIPDGQQTTIVFSNFADSQDVNFSASSNWMIQKEESSEWFTIDPEYGAAGNDLSLSVSVLDYTGSETLTGGFKIVSGNKEVAFTVIQMSEGDENNPYIKDCRRPVPRLSA